MPVWKEEIRIQNLTKKEVDILHWFLERMLIRLHDPQYLSDNDVAPNQEITWVFRPGEDPFFRHLLIRTTGGLRVLLLREIELDISLYEQISDGLKQRVKNLLEVARC